MTTEEKIRINAVSPYTSTGMEPWKKDEHCSSPDFEYTWDKVIRMRKERDPLIKGGRSRKNLATFNCLTTHKDQQFALGHEFCQYCHKKLFTPGPNPGSKQIRKEKN